MKKVIIAFIAGMLVMTSGHVMAEKISMIGKKVGGEAVVIVDGKEVSNAIIIEGKSYAPVRDIVETLGSEVAWEKGVITITTVAGEVNYPSKEAMIARKEIVVSEIEVIERDIEKLQTTIIPAYEEGVEKGVGNSEKMKEDLEKLKGQVVDKKKELAALKQELAAINEKLESAK